MKKKKKTNKTKQKNNNNNKKNVSVTHPRIKMFRETFLEK